MISEQQEEMIGSILSVFQTLPQAERRRLHDKLKTRLEKRRAGQSISIDQEAKTMSETATKKSAELVLNMIAGKAAAIDSLCSKTINDLPSAHSDTEKIRHDLENVAHLLVATRALAQQVGWMAEHLSGDGPGDALAWMMPSLYDTLEVETHE